MASSLVYDHFGIVLDRVFTVLRIVVSNLEFGVQTIGSFGGWFGDFFTLWYFSPDSHPVRPLVDNFDVLIYPDVRIEEFGRSAPALVRAFLQRRFVIDDGDGLKFRDAQKDFLRLSSKSDEFNWTVLALQLTRVDQEVSLLEVVLAQILLTQGLRLFGFFITRFLPLLRFLNRRWGFFRRKEDEIFLDRFQGGHLDRKSVV